MNAKRLEILKEGKRHRVVSKEHIAYPVNIYPLKFVDPNTSHIKGDVGVSVVREDTFDIICHAGSNYQLVKHIDVLSVVESVFDANGVTYELFDIHTGGFKGNKMYVDYLFPNNQFTVEGDAYIPFVQIRNSYDKSLLFSSKLGFYRLACLNILTLTINSPVFSRLKHVGTNINLDSTAINLNSWFETTFKYREQLVQLLHSSLDEAFMEETINKVFLAKRDKVLIKESNFIQIHKTEFGNTKYALLNALTNYVTHKYSNFTDNYDWQDILHQRIFNAFFKLT